MAAEEFRRLEKEFNLWMIAGAMSVSFLGTFTATQLMIQARTSTKFTNVLTWIFIVSLTFGFCSSWSLHFVGMISCKMDVPIGLDVSLTLFTGVLAVGFTFISLGKDILRNSYRANFKKNSLGSRSASALLNGGDAALPLLEHDLNSDRASLEQGLGHLDLLPPPQDQNSAGRLSSDITIANNLAPTAIHGVEDAELPSHTSGSVPSRTGEGRSLTTQQHWSVGTSKVDDLMSMATQGARHHKNVFIATFEALLGGLSLETSWMGLLWSLSLTCMHFGGLYAMKIPEGYMTFSPIPVILAALISWVVCIAGYIYLTNVEPFLSQQILFSVVAAVGIASMHFTGLHAATFYSRLPPSSADTWPATLPIAICSIAFFTCMLANGLLAHTAILSRNKLAEIVWTRRKLWRTMAEKELAEITAATRSSFIASASHEIRTPLHHLQGYTDLLAKSNLKDGDRQLVNAIQSATRTLSLITNNVLDWSKLESDMDTVCHPIQLDLRAVSESIVHVLPSNEEDVDVEFMVVVSPSVPKALLLDETYIHRILMNLLSNGLKFTRSGYVMLTMEYNGHDLIAKVKDTGCGIPPAFLPRLFEPFSQAQTRGSQRGTGLGLSIIKQLLHKMNGNITVESHYSEDHSSSNDCGTTFTVTIPAQLCLSGENRPESPIEIGTVAGFPGKDITSQEGQRAAWNHFGYKVIDTKSLSDLENCPEIKYIWADAEYLERNLDILKSLLQQDTWTVLVPYCSQEILYRLPGLVSSSRFVLLPKPLMWHTFQARTELATRSPPELLDIPNASKPSLEIPEVGPILNTSTDKEVTILLVEDNPVNQKLGFKMLTSLGYSVLLATDGCEAISALLTHDAAIDMILMDQSMPNKDGVTATREIRQLEAEGKLVRKHAIIAVTAVVNSESRASFSAAGADDFLSKPLSMGKLEQTLATFLRVE